MAYTYITTDTDVACTIVIDKKANGISLTEYPKPYSILEAFRSGTNSFAPLSVDEWQKMERSPREARIEAFKLYVEEIEGENIQKYQINEVYRASDQEPGIPIDNL